MAGYGQIYVEVDASVVNGGIATLSTSGNIGDGSTDGRYWLLWSYSVIGDTYQSGGFTGIDWYWDGAYNYIQEGWNASGLGEQGYDGFIKYLTENPNLSNLDKILGDWSDDQKAHFLELHKGEPGFSSCYTFLNPNS